MCVKKETRGGLIKRRGSKTVTEINVCRKEKKREENGEWKVGGDGSGDRAINRE